MLEGPPTGFAANLIFDIYNPFRGRSNPFRRDETFHTGCLSGLNERNLEMEMFPCNARYEDINLL